MSELRSLAERERDAKVVLADLLSHMEKREQKARQSPRRIRDRTAILKRAIMRVLKLI